MKISIYIIMALLCLSLILAGCGVDTADGTKDTAPVVTNPVDTTAATETFVPPADALGQVVSVSDDIITWYAFSTDQDTIDFLSVDVKKLDDASEEMSLFYLEENVSYYSVVNGKLIDAEANDAVKGAIVGITTLEEGVQEVYIIATPIVEEDTTEEEVEPATEEIVEDETKPTPDEEE